MLCLIIAVAGLIGFYIDICKINKESTWVVRKKIKLIKELYNDWKEGHDGS